MATEKINSTKTAAKSATARSTTKDNRTAPSASPKASAPLKAATSAPAAPAATPPATRKPRSEHNRVASARNPPYVLKVGGAYVHESASRRLTKSLASAWTSESESDIRKFGERLAEIYYPQVWPERPTVERLVVTRNRLIIGAEAVKDEFLCPNPEWAGVGRHNLALAEAAAFEHDTEDGNESIFIHRFYLMLSPMWALLKREFDEQMAAEVADGASGEPGDALGYVVARAFYAGICAGRRENGKRNQYGRLILDDPYMPEEESALDRITRERREAGK